MEKSIEERAKELGVPVIQPVKRVPNFQPQSQDFNKYIQPPIEAICGGCGKELLSGQMRQPCGRQYCPFGIFTNYTQTY